MVKTVKICTDNTIQMTELAAWRLTDWEKAIGADCTEKVATQIMCDIFGERVVMIVDESGAIKDLPVNKAASELYGIQLHGFPIHGDVIFAFQDGPVILPLDNPDRVMAILEGKFPYLQRGGAA